MDIAFGTKIINLKTKEIGLLIKVWKNKFADGIIDFATCVNESASELRAELFPLKQVETCSKEIRRPVKRERVRQGKRYNIELDNIQPLEDFE